MEQFDKYFKDKLYNHESNIPVGLWDKIAADKPAKRRFIAWLNTQWLVGAAAACAMLFTGTFVYKKIQKSKQESVVEQFVQQVKGSTQKSDINEKQVNAESQPKNKELNEAKLQKTNTTDKLDNIQINNNVIQYSTKETIEKGNLKVTENTYFPKEKLSVNQKQKHNKLHNESLRLENTDEILPQPSNFIPETVEFLGKSFGKHAIALKDGINRENPAVKESGKFSFSALRCPTDKLTDWYLEVYASPNLDMKTVVNYGVSEAYLRRKDSAEQMKKGYTVGVRIAKSITPNFWIKAGLQYTQINQLFTLRTENERKTTQVIITRTITDPSGNTQTFMDTTTVTQIGYRVRNTQNRYRSIEVPILASYQFTSGTWQWGISGGAILKSTTWYSGETFDTSYQIVSLTDKSPSFYHSNTSLSAIASLSIAKQINPNTALFAEPYFRYNLGKGATTAMGYNEKFNTAGIMFGIRVKLNNRRLGNISLQ